MDVIRKLLRRAHPEQTSFNKLKWVLFKRGEVLTDEQREALNQAFQRSQELRQAYQLRNSFHAIFDEAKDKQQAGRWLEPWVEEVRFTKNPAWSRFLKTLTNWKEPILNFVESGISNAVTEGCNNFIRYVRRVSFGIPNFEHMRLRVLANSA